MGNSGKKIVIVPLMLIVLIVIVGGVFAYTYLCTDTFRSSQELFAKYLTQNLEEIDQTVNLEKIKELEEKTKQSKYEEHITISYTEPEETDPIAQITIDTQKDSINKKTYGILSLMLEELENPLEVEYMKERDMYSLRFTNSVKQFLTVENSNLKQLAENLGMDEEAINQVPDTIDFELFSLEELKFTDEEKNNEINKYANLLYGNIAKEKYTKSKNVVITVNGKTRNTNAYILTLNEQDIKNVGIKLLETLKQDEIIISKLQTLESKITALDETGEVYSGDLKENYEEAIQEIIDGLNKEENAEENAKKITEENIGITVYEEKGNTVRIKIEKGLNSISVDTTETDGKKQTDINFTSIDEENTQLSYKVTFVRENDNKLNIQFTNIEGEEQRTVKLTMELSESENNTKLDVSFIDDAEGKTAFTRNINFVDEIDYKVVLDDSNNIILNKITAERMSNIFNALGPILTKDYMEPLDTALEPVFTGILAPLMMNQVQDVDFSEAEAVMFNSKFTAYEGTEVSTAQVNALLNTVFTHNQEEAVSGDERYVTVRGVVTLGVDATLAPKLEGSGYYKVVCQYDGNIINEIVITEVENSDESFTPGTITPSISVNETDNIVNTGEDIINELDPLN